MTDPGEPAGITTAICDQIEVIRLGAVVGLGVATRDGAAMATVWSAEARRIGEELIRLAALDTT